jgi:hypothetical protein
VGAHIDEMEDLRSLITRVYKVFPEFKRKSLTKQGNKFTIRAIVGGAFFQMEYGYRLIEIYERVGGESVNMEPVFHGGPFLNFLKIDILKFRKKSKSNSLM